MLTEFILVMLINHLELTNCLQSKHKINAKSKRNEYVQLDISQASLRFIQDHRSA